MMAQKRILAAAIVALFLGLATVPADAGRVPKFNKFAKKGHNAADLNNIGDRIDVSKHLHLDKFRDISEALEDYQRKKRAREAGLGCSASGGWRYCLIKKEAYAGQNFSSRRKKLLLEQYKWLPNTVIKRPSADPAE